MPETHRSNTIGWRPFVYGGAASMFAEMCTFPIDTSKTRLQIQGERITGKVLQFTGGTYRGMLHCLVSVARHEGLRSLYQGLSAALLRQSVYGTIKFGIYNHLKRAIVEDPMDETLTTNVFCAMFAGSFANAIANPADVLKIRLQAHTTALGERPSIFTFATKALRDEGYLSLYKGVGPTAMRAAIVCGAELPTYDIFKKHLILSGLMQDSKLCHFISSFVAGLCGALICNPIDVTRTRFMNQRRELISGTRGTNGSSVVPVRFYRNSLDCMTQTIKNEGIMALWKGFIPNWFRLGPWNIIFFMTYEQLWRLPM